jgi:hypothetical protein
MESIYYVMSFLCHRTCPHCYEDRFRPYYGEDLRNVVDEARTNFPRVIASFPERMTYLDTRDADAHGNFREKRGRIILAGGEILLEPVRESVLYPALELLYRKYRDQGGVQLIVQTTGDILTDRIVGELLERHVEVLSVSGIDSYHAGLELEPARDALKEKLARIFESHGMRELPLQLDQVKKGVPRSPFFQFWGATPDQWIGKLWPRGRAQLNELSTASVADNFCNGWSGGLNFLQFRHGGSEVSVEPNGNVYPCCMKTKMAIGNLLEENLEAILSRLTGNPVYEAISMGHPERMGITKGWSVDKFLEKSKTTFPSGRVYQNLCLGCDAFHEEVLMSQTHLVSINSLPERSSTARCE